MKVIGMWDPFNYFLGRPGDYLVANYRDPNDIYIIQNEAFEGSYESEE